MAVMLRADVAESLTAFASWLAKNPVDGDQIYGGSSVRYHVARYCDYLATNPWPGGDPLREHAARDGAVGAYGVYLDTFNTPPATIRLILANLDRFYVFLGMGAVGSRAITPPRRAGARR
jgi:hypothetical protein